MTNRKRCLVIAVLLAVCFCGLSTQAPADGASVTLVKRLHRKPHKRRHKHHRHKHHHKKKLGTLPTR
jgi:hypothetical protein